MRVRTTLKDSGIEWIGKIPKEWNLRKIKHTSYVKGRVGWQGLRSEEFTDEGPFLITGTDFENGKINWETCNHVEQWRYDQDSHIQLKENDILITKDGTIGKIALIDNLPDQTTLNSGVMVIRPLRNNYYPQFLYWVLNSEQFSEFINYIKTGTTINHLYQETFGNFQFAFPETLDEQKEILKFLNKKIPKIDLIIKNYRKMKNLLKEKKQSVLHHSVTKGIDPSVTMQDSEIDAIGKIPKHWDVLKLKQIGKLSAGGTPSTGESSFWENGTIPWISSGEVNNNIISEYVETITKLGLKNSATKLIPKGSILLAITGQGITRGRSSILEIDACTNQSVVAITLNPKIYNRFVWYYLQSQYSNLRGFSQGSVQSGLTLQILKNYPIPITSLEEQKKISSFLEKELEKVNLLSLKIDVQIKKLEEHRQSLIFSTITGKIAVRGEEIV